MESSQAGRRFWSIILKRNAVALAVVFILGILFDLYFYEPYDRSGFWAGIVAIAIYLAASFCLGLVNLLSGLGYNWLFQEKDLEETILDDLRKSKLPGPDDWQQKRFDYLAELADDDDLPADVRVKASALYAAYQVAIQRAGMFNGLALGKALDAATLRYAQEAPARRLSD